MVSRRSTESFHLPYTSLLGPLLLLLLLLLSLLLLPLLLLPLLRHLQQESPRRYQRVHRK